MGWRRAALRVFDRAGGSRLLAGLLGRNRLTVLAYHRITDQDDPGFVGYRGNVSASPEAFARQMDWVGRRHSPVSIDDVAAHLDGTPLPERPVLVTFDDGYRDNLDEALPILEERSIPATIFLATDHIGSDEPFWWDRSACLIARASRRPDTLPLLGRVDWSDPGRLIDEWVAAAKMVPNAEKLDAIDTLEDAVGTSPGSRFAETHLTWEQVRSMLDRGISFGAHTCSHPVLTMLGAADAADEITRSIELVASETGRSVVGFAYPNGLAGDYDDASKRTVADAGVRLAFTLAPGPARRREVLSDPLAIRRVYVDSADNVPVFAAKASGVSRLVR